MRKFVLFSSVVAAVMTVVAAPAARADVINYSLNETNLSGYAGPYAAVSVDRTDSTHATITFTSLISGGNIYLLGAHAAVDVNVNAEHWTLGTITGWNAGTGFSPGPWSNSNSGNVSDYGVFNQTVDSDACLKNSSDTIRFTLTNTSSVWADAASVLAPNNKGYRAAAHIIVTPYPADKKNGAMVTGYAGDSPVVAVPLPAAVWSTLGLLGVLGFGRMIRRRQSAV